MTRADMRRRMRLAFKAVSKERARQDIIEKILNYKKNGMPTLKSYVLRFILDRQEHGFTERMNLDDIWYYLRQNVLLPSGYVIGKYTRRSLKSYIQELCDLLEIKRETIGIIAQAYATLYFRGRLYPVAIDELTGLKDLGAFVLIIEKEGIVEVLKPYADEYGVALVTSHGFLTENATDLSTLIRRTNGGSNLAILTDFDISGLLIALNIPDIPRIGVDFDTLRDLGYDPSIPDELAEFEEEYEPVNNHWGAVQEHKKNIHALSRLYQQLLSDTNLPYLKGKRIEINAVKTAVGAERLWKFIMHKLHGIFLKANYNRATDVDELARVIPRQLSKLNKAIASKVATITNDSIVEYQTKLGSYDGKTKIFIDDDLQDIEGVGPSTARKFIEEGFKSVSDIAYATIDEIAEALICSEDSASLLMREARNLLDKRERENYFDNENDKKPDDYGFLKIEPCELKMHREFSAQVYRDDDMVSILDKIEELADELSG